MLSDSVSVNLESVGNVRQASALLHPLRLRVLSLAREPGSAADDAEAEGKKIATLSLKSQFRFDSPAQRTEFANAVRQALVDVIARHSSPNRLENGRPGKGRPFRLVLACYPISAGEQP
jgi:hypothetical protein